MNYFAVGRSKPFYALAPRLLLLSFSILSCTSDDRTKPAPNPIVRIVPVVYTGAWTTGGVINVYSNGSVIQLQRSLASGNTAEGVKLTCDRGTLANLLKSAQNDPRWSVISGVPTLIYGLDQSKETEIQPVDRLLGLLIDAKRKDQTSKRH